MDHEIEAGKHPVISRTVCKSIVGKKLNGAGEQNVKMERKELSVIS